MPVTTERAPFQLISVVVPVYNEEASLPALLTRTMAACDQTACRYEIVLVDDGSSDRSAEMLDAAASRPGSPVISVILNRNYGQHAAVMAGFANARGDLIITLDADLQNPPEEIPRLVAAAAEGYDVVGTIRVDRQDSWLRKSASRLINRMVKRATGQEMNDYGCMFRAYQRPIVDAMLQCQERSTFIPVLANSFARKTIELPVQHAGRAHGESKYDFLKLINLMFDLVTSMTTAPLRLASLLGCLIAGFGFALAVLILSLRFLLGTTWAVDGVFTLFAMLFIFIGAQFIGIGLLGEYIGRIYDDVRARPNYFVKSIIGQRAPVADVEQRP
ncbi:MAG: undecaprenyl-phosphate 4-deoxy-4-formamido-L-arabinose transferase [Porticoccaceae bacterium]|nr:MAG: undecaprenyl-phosphate 4-deoxy-4-formamido-L-arabinose transferase [Porticoccaceae bacterium]